MLSLATEKKVYSTHAEFSSTEALANSDHVLLVAELCIPILKSI